MENLLKSHLTGDQWLKDLFDHAHDLIHILHIDGRIIYVNRAWATMLEYSNEEIQGHSIYALIEEKDRMAYNQYRQQVLSNNPPDWPIIFNLISRSGKIISVEGFITAKIEKGQPVYTRGIFRDISVRLHNEAELLILNRELQEKQQNLQQLLINAPDAVIVINNSSRITFWNPKAEEIFGWQAGEVLDQRLETVIIPFQYREAHKKGMERYLSTGDGPVLNKTIEITALRRSGREFHVSLTISPTMQDGQRAFIAFIRDITEEKQNQLDLERKTKELEQFAHVSHHDLQEPLRKIIMFTDMVKTDSFDRLTEDSKKRFDKISDSAMRMSTALKDILNYASLSNHEQAIPVNLNEVLRLVRDDLELVITEKNASITVDDLPVINAIPQQMHQLFYNLLNNALKFVKEGCPPVIQITCRKPGLPELSAYNALDGSKQYYEIMVRDNGIGFSPEAASKIFGMFQRLHSKQEYAGTGIGLALCKKVVLNHGGSITAYGQEGEGAVFKILLPS